MPSTVDSLLSAARISLRERVNWGQTLQSRAPGVYIVSMSPSEHRNDNVLPEIPVSLEVVAEWLERVPALTLDGQIAPTPAQVCGRLGQFWMPDESILYIGMTSQPLRNRVRQYYQTHLGDKRPHRGGHWIKTLSLMSSLYVYVAECNDPNRIEGILIDAFKNAVSNISRENLLDPNQPLPFANLENRLKQRKKHGLGHMA